MTDKPAKPHTGDHFYVGYLPAPAPHRRFVLLMIALLSLWIVLLSAILVLTQRTPGRAIWSNSNEQAWTGILIEQPYPMLIPDDTESPQPLLVVSMGKAGAHDALRDAFNQRVTLRGYELHREGRRMIELSAESDAIEIDQPILEEQRPPLAPLDNEPIELIGEIIDGKCYLGAMKPGDGVAHRSCAALCLRGGLPPMFAAESDIGDHLYPLLLVDGTSELSDETIQLVATRVRVKGVLMNLAGFPVLSVRHEDIQPIGHFVMATP